MADSEASDEKEKVVVNKKIDTAVKFLQNARVQETPLAQRKAFLAKKGLTQEEIAEAIKQAGISDQENEAPALRSPQNGAISTANMFYRQPRWQDYFWVAVIGGGFGYTLVHLVKTYILPYFLEPKTKGHEKIEELQSSVRELKENLSETVGGIQDTLDSVQKLLQEQQEKVQNMSLSLSTSQSYMAPPVDSYTLSDVKSELSSIKGLFLSRQQFSAPIIQSSPIPRIPAWQRTDATVSRTQTGEASHATSSEGAKLTSTQNGLSSGEQGSSSGTLEVQDTQEEVQDTTEETGNEESHEESFTEPPDTSFSTMSSDVGSPNLSMSELKESLSETYVKVPTD